MFSDMSTYQEKDHVYKANCLQMFQPSNSDGMVQFSSKIINCLSITPQIVTLVIKEWQDGQLITAEDFEGICLLELFGFRENQ